MKKLILTYFILSLLLHTAVCIADQNKIDSLENLLKSAGLKNASIEKRTEVLNELAYQYAPISPEKSYVYANKALFLASSTNNKKEKAAALKNLGSAFYFQNNYEKALKYFQKSLKIKEELNVEHPDDVGNKQGVSTLLNNIGIIHKNMGNYKKSIEYYKKSLSINEELQDSPDEAIAKSGKEEIANSLRSIGIVYWYQGIFEIAVQYYQNALNTYKELSDKQGIADSYLVIGIIYHEWGKYELALEYYQKSLKIFEKLDNKKAIADSFNNIGLVYKDWGNYGEKALEYFQKSLVIMEELSNKHGIANSFTNIGEVYEQRENYEEAIDYYKKALEISEELGNKQQIAANLESIGNVYIKREKYEKALENHKKSLNIREQIGSKQGIASSLHSIGTVYNNWGNYRKAVEYYNESLKLAKEMKSNKLIKDNYENISEVYSAIGNNNQAFKYYKLYIAVKDTMFTEESHKQIAELETKYQTEKKEKEIALLNKDKQLKDLEIEKNQEQIKRQRSLIYFFVLGFLIVVGFSVLLYHQYNQKKKANEILAIQKQEITDSILYARRIQTAILPPESYINESLHQHFILNKPRDIVSGDFLWITQKDSKILVAVADCTGHGVPGAFMSMLGVAFLNEIVNKKEVFQANEILNQLRENVMISLHQTGKMGEAKDGMDIALSILDTTTNKLQYSGANNPLYIVRNNEKSPLIKGGVLAGGSQGDVSPKTTNLPELIEIKADKMPIGIQTIEKISDLTSFTNHEIKLEKGDTIYLFSDGYSDQFGGEKGKKFKYKKYKQLLVDIHDKPMDEQKEILDKTIEEWKGNLEQVDDILVMGIRI